MGIVLAIVLPPSHEETAITNLTVHLVPSDAGYVVVLFLWLQVMPCLPRFKEHLSDIPDATQNVKV